MLIKGAILEKPFPQTDLFPLIGLLFLEIRFTAVLQLCKCCSLPRVSTKNFLCRKFCFRFHYRNNHHIVKVLYIYYRIGREECYVVGGIGLSVLILHTFAKNNNIPFPRREKIEIWYLKIN